MPVRNEDGTYKRTRSPWSMRNFTDGYIDSDGRLRVYLPNHPRASNMGYVLRAIVAYEHYHKVSVSTSMCIHHLDGDRLNDSKENLLMIPFGEHTTMHKEEVHRKSLTERICKHCGRKFLINKWRLNQGLSRGTYCSQKCYHENRRN